MSATDQRSNNFSKGSDIKDFRDQIATVDKEGSRIWIYPKKPGGRYYTARNLVGFILLAILVAGPFITIGGKPLLQLNILERKFYIFGIVFWPQDLYLFGLVFITLIVFITLFTVVFGRVFCGWACPQTIFMELVFRKIEYLIEGDAKQQRRLNNGPWTFEKIIKKGTKLGIFYLISFLISNIFLAYIIGADDLFKIINDPISEHLTGFLAMIAFSLVFFWVFAWFREQVCTLVCPYGRLQGVLLDQNSIVVHYDFIRGEPRTRGKGTGVGEEGDCIDCYKCVEICPTGIDIRNGTQLECVNCTACMDACDEIMEKVKRPGGLIRYASYNSVKNGVQNLLTERTAGYSILLFILVALVGILLAVRTPIEATVLRTPGVLYERTSDGFTRNLYNMKVVNKTYDKQNIEVKLIKPGKGRISQFFELSVEPDDLKQTVFYVELPPDAGTGSVPIELEIWSSGEKIKTVKSSFTGPANQVED